jgi:hypothetical protein
VEKNVVSSIVRFDKPEPAFGVEKLDLSSFHSVVPWVVDAPPPLAVQRQALLCSTSAVTQVAIIAGTSPLCCGSGSCGLGQGFHAVPVSTNGQCGTRDRALRNFGG